ncbi:putative membrane protein [Thermobifida halotolerans]|uniref:hypothetical protein n=1 Tax=Thermobifida halotolerans TaxID=483545 RepID=UPI0035178496
MSKPSLASKISDAFKRLFGRSTRPVVSSKPEDMAAADAPATRAEGDVTETTPAETADADAAAEFATEAVSSGEQRPTTQPPEPGKPLETSKAPEAAGAPEQAPETARGGGDSARGDRGRTRVRRRRTAVPGGEGGDRRDPGCRRGQDRGGAHLGVHRGGRGDQGR